MNKFIKIVIIVSLLVTLSLSVEATPKYAEWNSANQAYAAGDFSKALELYSAIEKEGYSSERLYYNLGNTNFKLNQYGKAILYYERALKLSPSNSDIKKNLEIVKEFTLDEIEVIPEFILKTWVKNINYSLSSNGWARIGLIFFVIAAIFALGYFFAPTKGYRKLSFFLSIVALSFVLFSFSFAWSQKYKYNREMMAIVIPPVTSIKSAPNSSGKSLFVLHEGTKVEVVEKLGKWNRIELSDGRQGWMQSADGEII